MVDLQVGASRADSGELVDVGIDERVPDEDLCRVRTLGLQQVKLLDARVGGSGRPWCVLTEAMPKSEVVDHLRHVVVAHFLGELSHNRGDHGPSSPAQTAMELWNPAGQKSANELMDSSGLPVKMGAGPVTGFPPAG